LDFSATNKLHKPVKIGRIAINSALERKKLGERDEK